jgi:hypothetical protein
MMKILEFFNDNLVALYGKRDDDSAVGISFDLVP